MAKYRDASIFFSGRILSLVVLLGFQLLIVRLLDPIEYGRFAIVVAWGAVAQVALSFGVQRVVPKYLAQVGHGLRPAAARKLVRASLGVRLGLAVAAIIGTQWASWRFGLASDADLPLLAGALLYIPATMAQNDADAMAQALGLQRVSRIALVGENVGRFALVAGAAGLGRIGTAVEILLIGGATCALSALLLLLAVRRALAGMPERAGDYGLDRREALPLALGGYVSTMAWFLSSPGATRIVAGHVLSVVAFAGFSFAQTLVLSFQRYMPAMLLFPFVEPAVLRHHARTGDVGRLEAALSLLIKIDLMAVGGAIVGCIVAGEPLIALLTGGRYAQSAFVLPFVLAYVSSTAIYRAFEIVAVALGDSAAMLWTLAPSLIGLCLALWLAPHIGIWVVLVYPLADAAARLSLFRRALSRYGVHHVLDLPVAAGLILMVAVIAGAGVAAVWLTQAGAVATIGIGIVAGLAYGGSLLLMRPLRHRELAIFGEEGPRALLSALRRFARS
jgi:O-antigen/teichoic acid export membrane protein